MTNIQFINNDCLTGLKELPSNSAQLIITSPPYNMNLRIRNGKYCSRQIVKEFSTKYDNGFSDNMPMNEYYEFHKNVLIEMLRVSDCVFYNIQILTGNKPAFFKLIGYFHEQIKEMIIWDKVNAQPAMGEGVLNSRFEIILVLGSNPISRNFLNAQFKRGTLENLWQIKRGKKVSKIHGVTFPEELVDKIILNFSKKGDLIIDPFMGTGTVAARCHKHERDFIGFEIDNRYIDEAKKRLKIIE